jgi:hypothetical protein
MLLKTVIVNASAMIVIDQLSCWRHAVGWMAQNKGPKDET